MVRRLLVVDGPVDNESICVSNMTKRLPYDKSVCDYRSQFACTCILKVNGLLQAGKGAKRKGKLKRSDGSFSDSSNSFIRQVNDGCCLFCVSCLTVTCLL